MIEVKLLRKGSRGLSATIENAKHHAQPCLSIISKIETILYRVGQIRDFTWEQGNNIHIITNWNEDKICFRPYIDSQGRWGIDVNAKLSRSNEMRLMTLMATGSSVDQFESFFKGFVTRRLINTYGHNENGNNSRAQ